MTPRLELRVLRSFAFVAGLTVSIIACATSGSFAAEEVVVAETAADFSPGADRTSMRPPATFFSINAVLAKHDQQRGRGPGAIRLASLTPPSNSATDAQPASRETAPAGKDPFGLFTFRAPEGLLWRKWRGVEAAMAKEQAVLDQCRADAGNCPSYAAQFMRLIHAVKSKSGRVQLDEANRAVNTAIRYVSDYALHGEADRWSTPLATFATAKGDCEDYAIAKYVALSEAGFPREDLQLVLVRDRAVRQDHAVLAARLDGRWLILDSRHSTLVEDSDASSLTPLFAINQRGVHLFAAPYAKRPLLADEVEAAPAAAGGDVTEWTGAEASSDGSFQLFTLPLLM
ncbi:transglutaminase-like cysteine peptidase [Bradyrhizobium sediminis]|uniref:Transglutaminase-like cysteine peptidase n=1 Tax=Bradyrhizobium sediminis TaxID=2840469 RepID=A0A975NLF1_9BRAD|nr:transglutaminase-like cysteine peptidase [Bradyrhizobium sediminis]QWG16189.1 transglutaminase-like cysteine peptidase [Bradyrhizobium sediminis]